jgi:hypothetical protein
MVIARLFRIKGSLRRKYMFMVMIKFIKLDLS